jgi:hypothetical protein
VWCAATIGAGAERGKDDQDDGGEGHGEFSGVVIGQVAEGELADDSASKGDRGDVLGSGRVLVFLGVYQGKHGVDAADHLGQFMSAMIVLCERNRNFENESGGEEGD